MKRDLRRSKLDTPAPEVILEDQAIGASLLRSPGRTPGRPLRWQLHTASIDALSKEVTHIRRHDRCFRPILTANHQMCFEWSRVFVRRLANTFGIVPGRSRVPVFHYFFPQLHLSQSSRSPWRHLRTKWTLAVSSIVLNIDC
nr:hypothetical protein CFP56_30738 [Quercus suber]